MFRVQCFERVEDCGLQFRFARRENNHAPETKNGQLQAAEKVQNNPRRGTSYVAVELLEKVRSCAMLIVTQQHLLAQPVVLRLLDRWSFAGGKSSEWPDSLFGLISISYNTSVHRSF